MRQVRVDRVRVAEIARDAAAVGMSPAAALQEILGMNAGQARYYLAAARKDGLLNLSADMHRPTVAVIHRGSAQERSWEVCSVCLATWPCPDAPQ